MLAFKKILHKASNLRCCVRWYSNKPIAAKKKVDEKHDPCLVRNIGILAHIDAGKTTTTERMLFFSGMINSMGEVHHGNTVTDFMDQERERGITITAASVTIPWDKYLINLLDTPGHIDFTMEVEQTLNVMDGAVVVLDGSAGVEAQTLTVWRQADRYRIPRLIYVNKMDRADAGFFQSVHSVQTKLHTTPIVLQVPYFSEDKAFKGVIDLINMESYEWEPESRGLNYMQKKLTREDGKLWENAMKSRIKLTETLVDLDMNLTGLIISDKETVEEMPASHLTAAVKNVTESLKAVPILCGSSYKNMGVQLLMDSIVQYLPSPVSNPSSTIFDCFKDNLCARAFKIRHDKFKGPVTFFRIYSGSMTKDQNIYNMRLSKSEKCQEVLVAYADDYEEPSSVGTGSIVAVTGLKVTQVGDLITSSASVVDNAKKRLESKRNVNESENVNEMFAVGALVPDPVFFCSIEPPSGKYQLPLEKALGELGREDPSLRVSIDQETGEIILGGMGELHLDVIKERLRKDYKIAIGSGPLRIAYQEEISKLVRDNHSLDRVVGKSVHSVRLTMSAMPMKKDSSEILLLDKSPESIPHISSIHPKHLVAVKLGVERALENGPKIRCPVANTQVMLHYLEVGKGTADSMITSAATQCVTKLLKMAGTKLLEPLMSVEVVCSNDLMPLVLGDIGRRRALIKNTDMRGTDRVIEAIVPLSELLGYASHLRIITSGQASFTMEFHTYGEINPEDEAEAIRRVTGFSTI